MGETDGKPYFDKWIDGYHFIVLNTEKALKDSAYLSEEQLVWLEEKLDGQDQQKPVFVCIHQALNDSHYRSNLYKGFGDADERVKEILKNYPQAVFLSGHIHNGFGVASVIDREYGTLVDVPSFNESENGYTEAGSGYQVNIYPDKIQLRARNFVTSQWLPEYDVNIALDTLPVVYQEASRVQADEYTEESYRRLKASMDAAEEFFALEHEHFTDSSNVPEFVPVFTREVRDNINVTSREMAAALDALVEKETEPDTPDNPHPDEPSPDTPDTPDPDEPSPDTPDNPDPDDPAPDNPDTPDPDDPAPDTPDNPTPDNGDCGSTDQGDASGNPSGSDPSEGNGPDTPDQQGDPQNAAVATGDALFPPMVVAAVVLAAGICIVATYRKKQ